MSETKKLRSELTKRGIEWSEYGAGYTEFLVRTGVDAKHYTVQPNVIGSLILTGLTHEQVIAATLGAWTCQVDTTENWLPAERYHRCKHCGAFFAVLDASSDIPPRFCPNCGRKVVDE